MAVVYRHRRNDTGEVFYVGVGTRKDRPYQNSPRSQHWKNIVNKHGRTVEILAENIPREDAIELEMFLIEEYGRKDLGKGCLINYTDGGEGAVGRVLTEEHKQKISASHKSLPLHVKISQLEKAWEANKGKKLTREHKLKISNPVEQLTLDGKHLRYFDSASQVVQELGIYHVGEVCKGKRKTAGGYKWKYANN